MLEQRGGEAALPIPNQNLAMEHGANFTNDVVEVEPYSSSFEATCHVRSRGRGGFGWKPKGFTQARLRQCRLNVGEDALSTSWFVHAGYFVANSPAWIVSYATKLVRDGSYAMLVAGFISITLTCMVLTVAKASNLVRIVREGGHHRCLLPRGRARLTSHLATRRVAIEAFAQSGVRLLAYLVFGLLLLTCHATLFGPDASASNLNGHATAVTSIVPEHDHCADIVPTRQFVQDDQEVCVALGGPRITEANPFKLLAIETNATIDDAYAAYKHKKEVYGVANGGHAQDVAKITHAYCVIHEAKLGAKSPLGETWLESTEAWLKLSVLATANAAGILVLVLVAMDRKLSSGGTIDQGPVATFASFMVVMMCVSPALGAGIGSSERTHVRSAANGKASDPKSNLDDAIPHNVMDHGEPAFKTWNHTPVNRAHALDISLESSPSSDSTTIGAPPHTKVLHRALQSGGDPCVGPNDSGAQPPGASQCTVVQPPFGQPMSTNVIAPPLSMLLERTDNSYGVTSGDWNGDGLMDAMVANYWGGNEILIGDGQGGFTSTLLERTDASSGVTSGDWNGDGLMDA
eukprot:COSAG06_NODE_2908_length_6105_cov_9.949384_1_plen_575_part_10